MARAVDFVAVIPARFASTRLPGKPLADIAGKPMIVRVAEQARVSGAGAVYVATDHAGVARAGREHGFDVVMTRADHPSGTDRIAEVARKLAFDPEQIVVNVQGDEPMIAPELIRSVAALLARDRSAVMATACHPIRKAAEFFDPNVVKVVLDAKGGAMYFSRAPIPWARDAFASRPAMSAMAPRSGVAQPIRRLPATLACYRHIGIYAYRASFLAKYAKLKPAPIEQYEALEQLRVLWHGYRIAVAVHEDVPEPGVDTATDLERVRAAFRKKLRQAGKAMPLTGNNKIDRPRKAR